MVKPSSWSWMALGFSLLLAAPATGQSDDSKGWRALFNEKTNECYGVRYSDEYQIALYPKFDHGQRMGFQVSNKNWNLPDEVKAVEIEFPRLGSVSVPGIHRGTSLGLVLPKTDSEAWDTIAGAMEVSSEILLKSELLAETGGLAIPVSGFAAIRKELAACENRAAEARGLKQENTILRRELCDKSLEALTLLRTFGSDYSDEDREDIARFVESLEQCGKPAVAKAVKFLMLDNAPGQAADAANSACADGDVAGCYFEALIAAYGDHPKMTAGDAKIRARKLCEEGYSVGCELLKQWDKR